MRPTISASENPNPDNWALFRRGILDGFSLPAFMVFASMIGYGALVHSAGLGLAFGVVSTLGIWGLPGQVALIEYMLLGAPLASMLIGVSLANMRFLPMSMSLAPLFRGSETGWKLRYLWVQFMSVNTWVGLLRRVPELEPDQRGPFYAGFSTICMVAGAAGVSAGFLMAEAMPVYITVMLVFLNPIYFAFIFAAMRARAGLLAFGAGAIVGPPVYLLTPDWSLPVAGIIAGSVGYFADRWLRKSA